MMTKVTASKAVAALIKTIETFGEDIYVEIKFPMDPHSQTIASIFLPSLKSQTSMPFTPNIYAPHGAIFSQN